ncbi:hypothetical protein [Chitinophaga nivalis]|uniref:DUF4834 domain-containing protein n=1 Tax=Chitinophaga nivalis TaxID=2991709 RepID=A0ABT3IV14_9BACT|nr:hypothetical protein [Chitinophaga nivalis]MCW3462504.1 hypothetical protein [Chitinophaga nivalis]MCW3487805.1 hypothetical protein [Chitinophaga nivalis]
MLKFALTIFIAWLLYKLVFDFLIPAYKLTKQARRQMSDIQQRMREQYEEQQASQQGYTTQHPPVQKPAGKPGKDDYIDFEEIK